MKFMSRKLIIAGGAIALTAACAVTVTYAWFARNNVAWIDEYDYNVKSSAGILISTDGTTYTQNVSKSEIKKVIENWAGDNANYSELKYGQSTLGTYENGNITIDENGYPNMYTVVAEEKEETSGEYPNEYDMVMADATKTDYLSFDLWLSYRNTAITTDDVDVYFDLDTTITSKYTNEANKFEMPLVNKLTIATGEVLDSGDTISYDPADAMRVLVTVIDDNDIANSKSVLYEPSLGLGSAAVEGMTDETHNKNTNAMYTYWNSLFGEKAFTKAPQQGNAYLDTETSFTENAFTKFKYDSTYNNESSKLNYKDIHVVITVFMEGWDADYIIGTPNEATNFKVNLAFTVNNPNEDNGD